MSMPPQHPQQHQQQQQQHQYAGDYPPQGSVGMEEDIDDGQQQSSKDAVMDLSSFDKEYILKGLARLYRKKILPLELSSRYGHFHSPPLSPSDFDAPPMVLLLGQYR